MTDKSKDFSLKPFTMEEFLARYELSEKQFQEGKSFSMEEAKKYFEEKYSKKRSLKK